MEEIDLNADEEAALDEVWARIRAGGDPADDEDEDEDDP